LIKPVLLVTRTADEAGLEGVGFAVPVDGAGSVVVPDWKYEHPNAASATTRIVERIV
jgi:hypothetical protein